MKYRKLMLIAFFQFVLVIISGCRASVSNVQISPTTQPQPETQAAPTPQDYQEDVWLREKDEMKMVYIPGGTFQMGSTEIEIEDAIKLCQEHYSICNRWYYERESPTHSVSLDEFWIDQTEVSNAQYRLCVEAGSCVEPTNCKKGAPTFGDPDKSDHPVVCINWEEALNYCEWAGTRLPTEAEWEYAFRGVERRIYPWGNAFDGTRLNYCDVNCSQAHADDRFDDTFSHTAPVGSFSSGISWAGVSNMSGNVSEWVADWFGEYSDEARTNPSGPITGNEKMIKGCSWFFHPTYCRGSFASVSPDTRFDDLGFRCVAPDNEPTEPKAATILDPIVVQHGDPPAIDGTHSSGEWDDALIETFADGSQLLLMHADGDLYLGLRANEPGMIAANVFIRRGDEISILHASAALGTAIYQLGEDNWQQTQDFTWQCRSTSLSAAAQAERDAFLLQDGWVAANGRMGTPNELEYQIKIPAGDFRLAAVYIQSSPPYKKTPWPARLTDDTIEPTPGGLPKMFYFSPEEWAALELE